MILGMYNNYHKNFRISLEICIVVMTSAFCLFMSPKNRHCSSFSLAALNAAKFGPKYYTDHSDRANMFLEGETKYKTQIIRFLLSRKAAALSQSSAWLRIF